MSAACAASRGSGCACRQTPRLCRGAAGDRPGGDQARPGAGDAPRPGRRRGGREPACSCRTICRPSHSRRSRRRSRPVSAAPLEQFFTSIDQSRSAPPPSPRSIAPITTEGREVAVKVLRPGIEDEFARAIETYEWAAAHVELLGGEAERLRPRMVIAYFKQWVQPRARPDRARRPRPPSFATIWSPSRASTSRRLTGGGPRGGC